MFISISRERIRAIAGISILEGIKIEKYPLVEYWLLHTDEFVPNGLELMKRFAHGKCGETVALDKFLYRAEEILKIKRGTLTMEQAQEVLFNTVSHARAVKGKVHPIHLHNTYKKACDSCNPMLKSFNITEVKIK